ncbi:MAG: hypothetical protein ACTHMP_09125, partial [Thermomicrobiales bacterium]
MRNREFMRRATAENREKYRHRWREASRKRQPTEQQRAREKLNGAVRRGIIVRPCACARCGAVGRVPAHHAGYSKPLEVEW